MLDRNYGGVIWTNHALERLRERGIKQSDAWVAFRNPDQSRYATTRGAWIYYKTWNNTRIEVVATQNEKKEWIIVSVWSKPSYKGKSKKEKKKSFVARLADFLYNLATK